MPTALLALSFCAAVGMSDSVRDDLNALSRAAIAPVVDTMTVTEHTFGSFRVVRLRPWLSVPGVGAVPVDDGDHRVLLQGDKILRFDAPPVTETRGSFALTKSQAWEAAKDAALPAWRPGEEPVAHRVFLHRGSLLQAAWRVRVGALHPQRIADVWVDAQTGDILKRAWVARDVSAPAQVFEPAPDVSGVDAADLVDVQLDELVTGVLGETLRGHYFQPLNCCSFYTCSGGGTDCPVADRLCATEETVGALESRQSVITTPESFGVEEALFPNGVHVSVPECLETTRAVAADNGLAVIGWFDQPNDPFPVPGAPGLVDSEIDPFAEVQTYWAAQSFFDHTRTVMENPAFCLRSPTMACDGAGAPILSMGEPLNTMSIVVNAHIPSISFSEFDFQYNSGRGVNAGLPFLLFPFRFDNAFFIPAATEPLSPEDAIFAPLVDRPRDTVVMFQGLRDLGYDGGVVRHEVVHGYVQTLSPNLMRWGGDSQGSHIYPGALNEAWADYFSSDFADSPLVGPYIGPIRDLSQPARCGEEVLGEEHFDAQPWSNALWNVRETLGGGGFSASSQDWTRILWTGVAMSSGSEGFEQQAQTVLDIATADAAFDTAAVDMIRAAFEANSLLDCPRVVSLRVPTPGGGFELVNHPFLLQPSPDDIGIDNAAPSALQFYVTVPDGATQVNLSWGQDVVLLDGALSAGIDREALLTAVLNEGGPIDWRYEGTQAVPYDHEGNPIPFDPVALQSQIRAGVGDTIEARLELQISPETEEVYISLVSTESAAFITNVVATFSFFGGPEFDPFGDGSGCNAAGGSWVSLLVGLGLLRRKRVIPAKAGIQNPALDTEKRLSGSPLSRG